MDAASRGGVRAMTSPAQPALPNIPRLPVEEVPPGEADAIKKMIRTLKDQLTKRYPKGVVRRDAHPKHHGLVKASFIIDEQIPIELRYGLFSTPGSQCEALIRFSNGNPIVGHDLIHDIRGFAIKLLLGPKRREAPLTFLSDAEGFGLTHDFVTATGEAFFGRDAVDFVDFVKVSENGLKVLAYFLRRFPSRLRGGLQMLSAQACPRSPLDTYFFSQAPYRLGPHCVKYQVRRLMPRQVRRDPWYRWFGVRHVLGTIVTGISFFSRGLAIWLPGFDVLRSFPGFDVLRSSLQRDLRNEEATLEFLVQRWPDLSKLPVWAIENATRRWNGPWVRVARIEIPRRVGNGQPSDQLDVGSPENLGEAERMNFTPWRALPDHQPLGSVNRARLAIYREMSRFRNEHPSRHQHAPAASNAPEDTLVDDEVGAPSA
jgi:hypothetical protein